MDQLKNKNKIILSIGTVLLSILFVNLGAVAVEPVIDIFNSIPIETVYNPITLSDTDKLELGCNKVNNKLFNSSQALANQAEILAKLQDIYNIHFDTRDNTAKLIDDSKLLIANEPELMDKSIILSYLDIKFPPITNPYKSDFENLNTTALNLNSNVGKYFIDKAILDMNNKSKVAVNFVNKSINSKISKLSALAATDKIKKTDALAVLDNINSEIANVMNILINEYLALNTNIEEGLGTIISTKVDNSKCIFSIKTKDGPQELTVNNSIKFICKLKTGSDEVIIDNNNQCFITK